MTRIMYRCLFALMGSFYGLLAHATPLQFSMSPGANDGTVKISLSNISDETVSILVWDTPFEDTLSNDVFAVETGRKGFPFLESATYTGRLVKRAPASSESYIELAPGKTLSKQIELNDYYEVARNGSYSVSYVGDIKFADTKALSKRSLSVTRQLKSLANSQVLSQQVDVVMTPSLSARLRTPAFANCSANQQTIAFNASRVAETMAQTALSDLRSLTVNERFTSPRYTEWFGAYSQNRYSQVVSGFDAMENALANQTLQFDCNCNEDNVFAFVFPNRPFEITLCPEFWRASINGTDSQAGTIIHEISHFTVLGGTVDHAYRQGPVRELANTNPDFAVQNADSYEYFAENNPVLPIRETISDSSNQFQIITAGTEVRGNLNEGSSRVYQASDIQNIELVSLTGDADLFVYSDSNLSNEICRSQSTSTSADFCPVEQSGTVYIQVFGYSETSYSLVTNAVAEPAPVENFDLQVDVAVNGSVARNTRDVYRVTGADSVILQTNSGDADLAVFNAIDLTSGSLVCESNVNGVGVDSCAIPSSPNIHYITVFGFADSNYSILARSASANNPTRITPGRAVTGDVSSGNSQYYIVSGADTVVLTSVSGDADLFVTNSSSLQVNGSSCISDLSSQTSITDTCSVADTGDQYVVVNGFTDASYTLLATPRDTVPVDDDSEVVVGRRGGGGSLHFLLLFCLSAIAGSRASKKG